MKQVIVFSVLKPVSPPHWPMPLEQDIQAAIQKRQDEGYSFVNCAYTPTGNLLVIMERDGEAANA